MLLLWQTGHAATPDFALFSAHVAGAKTAMRSSMATQANLSNCQATSGSYQSVQVRCQSFMLPHRAGAAVLLHVHPSQLQFATCNLPMQAGPMLVAWTHYKEHTAGAMELMDNLAQAHKAGLDGTTAMLRQRPCLLHKRAAAPSPFTRSRLAASTHAACHCELCRQPPPLQHPARARRGQERRYRRPHPPPHRPSQLGPWWAQWWVQQVSCPSWHVALLRDQHSCLLLLLLSKQGCPCLLGQFSKWSFWCALL